MKCYLVVLSLLVALVSQTASFARDVQVKEHTRKDGTVVKAHTRQVKDKNVTQPETIQVKGYTRKDGTVVKGYTRRKPTKAKKS